MLQSTMLHLGAQGFLRDEKPWRAGIADRAQAILLKNVVDTEDEIVDKALAVYEIREQILGKSGDEEVDKELDQLVGSIVSVGDAGRVQKGLENGHILCSTRVKRVLHDGEDPVGKSGRFISGDPDVVERFFEQPLIDKAVKSAGRAHKGTELAGRRIPVLAQRRPALAQKAQEQLALALPLKT